MDSEKSQPPIGGPIIRPRESKDDNRPVELPCPAVDIFVSKEETLGRITPFPNPKIVKKIAAVVKLCTSNINPKPMAEIIIPPWITDLSPYFFVKRPTNPP